jgi:hypothetical protein
MTQLQRNHKIKCHYGANDYFEYYRHQGGTLSHKQFGEILLNMNRRIAERILEGYSFKMPCRMGVLAVTKKKEYLDFKEGKAVTNRPIDFKSTLEMWEKYPETKAEKKLVRYLNKHTNGYIYKIAYNRFYATFKNKSVYSVQVNRLIKRTLAQKLFSGFELDALVDKPKYTHANKH